MLQGIFDVLASIGDFFASVVGFVSDLINDLVSFVQSLLEVPAQIATVLGGFPLYFIAGITSLIAIMIVLRVVGRD